MENICKNCSKITFIDGYSGVGRCDKWKEVINVLSIEKCFTTEIESKKIIKKENDQLSLFN